MWSASAPIPQYRGEDMYLPMLLRSHLPTPVRGLITVEMNSSMVLLPEEPMKQRLADRRVGWFNTRVTDYGLDCPERPVKELTWTVARLG